MLPAERRKLRCLPPVLIAALPLVAHAAAAPSVHDPLLGDQLSVRELMRIETDQAMARARTAGGTDAILRARHDVDSDAASGTLVLVGIYGTGTRLTAHVLVDGTPHLFRQGHARAVAQARTTLHDADVPPDEGYSLRGITSSCVRLEREGRPATLCLHPQLHAPAEQP